jgi:cytoskeletal protein CcmA (bactofilin family)
MLAKSGMFKRGHDSMPSTLSISSATTSLNSVKSPAALSIPSPPAEALAPSPPIPATDHKPAEVAPKQATASGSKLIVGPDVKLKGAEILDCDTLVVEGRVEATMDSRVIQIATGGAFSGKVVIDVAEVHGQFDGELTARSHLLIHASGRVSGKIRYGKITIEEGGELSGDVAALAAENPNTSSLKLASVGDA